MKEPGVVPASIQPRILTVRGQKVMLDSDLAELYGVETFNLNKAVKRNTERFPSDFMFQLTPAEHEALRFQSGMIKRGRGQHRKYAPYVFTEQGVAMLSSVLRGPRAITVNIFIMRAFVKLREVLSTNRDLADRLASVETKVTTHDVAIRGIVEAIEQLVALPAPATDEADAPKEGIGFHPRQK